MKKIAYFISIIFSPALVLLPVAPLLVYRSTQDIYLSFKWMIFTSVFISLVVVFIYLGVKRGLFSDLEASTKEQRPILFLYSCIVAVLYFMSLYLLNSPSILYAGISSVIFGLIIAGVINYWIKVSLHTATISAFSISIMLLFGIEHFYFIGLVPLVGWSRVKLKRHSIKEAILGSIVGVSITIIIFILVKYII